MKRIILGVLFVLIMSGLVSGCSTRINSVFENISDTAIVYRAWTQYDPPPVYNHQENSNYENLEYLDDKL